MRVEATEGRTVEGTLYSTMQLPVTLLNCCSGCSVSMTSRLSLTPPTMWVTLEFQLCLLLAYTTVIDPNTVKVKYLRETCP